MCKPLYIPCIYTKTVSCEKCVAPKCQGEKRCEWWPRNGCDNNLMAKILITIQENPPPSFTRTQHQSYLNCCY